MARYVSFAILLTVLIFVSIVFFKVMAGFLIPLFLAALLVVIFSPLHDWILEKLSHYKQLREKRRAAKLAALLSTAAVCLSVLIPALLMLLFSFMEARSMVGSSSAIQIVDKLKQARASLGLEVKAANEIRTTEKLFTLIRENMKPEELEYQRQLLFDIEDESQKLANAFELELPAKAAMQEAAQQRLEATVKENEEKDASPENETPPVWEPESFWEEFCYDLYFARQLNSKYAEQSEPENFHQYKVELTELDKTFQRLKKKTLYGNNAWLKELVNPTDEELEKYSGMAFQFASDQLFKFGTASTSFLASICVGIAIMLFALYFFLLDGHNMIESLKGLSPMDDLHEQELIDEFGKISRAVVLATLLSALAQGALAGIGYYFAGLESIFLLTMLTTCLALVPFVGAAAVWVPSCFYLYLVEGNMGASIGLAIYGFLGISMIDNFIKPAVLHGHSNLHPLLAFLSIIGGVSALGPIGILIGPMIVVFLQTLLEIFQREIRSLDIFHQGESGNDEVDEPNPNDAPHPNDEPPHNAPELNPSSG